MNAALVDLWPAVAAARAAFLGALEGVSEADALRHPGGDEAEWCVLQVAQHVLGWTLNVDEVIEQAAGGVAVAKHPRGYLPPAPPATLAEVRAALTAASARFLALAERVPAMADEALTVNHEVYGDLNYAGWFARCAAHDAGHLEQVLAVKREF
ncbi:MAG: DinB family protein [Dehalococcoidia bacterium]